jgi:hypothetical protein
MTYPVFASGDVLNASDMNGVGLWLVKSQTVGTGVTAVGVTGAFPSDYNAFKVVYQGGVASTGTTIGITLGASATGYSIALPYVSFGGAVALGTSTNNTTFWSLAGYGTASGMGLNVDILDPNLARFTRGFGWYVSEAEAGSWAGIHKVATAYTDFTLSFFGGNATGGTVSVYGYRK